MRKPIDTLAILVAGHLDRPAVRPPVRILQPEVEYGQNPLLGPQRLLPVAQTAGTGPASLAVQRIGHRGWPLSGSCVGCSVVCPSTRRRTELSGTEIFAEESLIRVTPPHPPQVCLSPMRRDGGRGTDRTDPADAAADHPPVHRQPGTAGPCPHRQVRRSSSPVPAGEDLCPARGGNRPGHDEQLGDAGRRGLRAPAQPHPRRDPGGKVDQQRRNHGPGPGQARSVGHCHLVHVAFPPGRSGTARHSSISTIPSGPAMSPEPSSATIRESSRPTDSVATISSTTRQGSIISAAWPMSAASSWR